MIHYHGGPIWPENAGAVIWRGRHGFVSFAHPGQIGVAADVCQSFAVDNGAFTAWKGGKAYDFDGYVAWVKKWQRHPRFDFCLIPDKIDGTEEENRLLLERWPLHKYMSVPVWHLHESLIYLDLLVTSYPRVAIGSSGEYAQIGTQKWWSRMAEAMNHICDGDGRPPCKLHGLRMLNPDVFKMFPFSSADSTNVAQNTRESKRWKGPYKPPNNISRGCLLADRIEAHNSAAYWTPQPVQQGLWA